MFLTIFHDFGIFHFGFECFNFHSKCQRSKILNMIKLIIFFVVWFVSGQQYAHAHGGMLDTLDCHRDLKAGTYHCHQGEYSGRDFKSEQEVMDLEKNKEVSQGVKVPGKLLEHIRLSGKARVTDGDTIRFGETRVRFFGIDAPEIKQKCVFNDKTWNCGIEARIALVKMIAEQEVSCEKKDKDRYGRIVAVCKVGGVNLNALMVREGWALAYRKYSRDYVDEELIAKDGKTGLWKGTFKRPWEWRRSKRSSNRN